MVGPHQKLRRCEASPLLDHTQSSQRLSHLEVTHISGIIMSPSSSPPDVRPNLKSSLFQSSSYPFRRIDPTIFCTFFYTFLALFLRPLSTFFCLNSTHQSHITVAFIEVLLAAMNGQEVDWPQEFHNHRRLENLMTTFTSKPSTKFME